MILDENAKNLISIIISSGYKAYAVGGCVRDHIMGIQCGDIDITTSAKPDELEEILKKNNIRFIETGIKHGTVTAVIDKMPYEITTFRCDGEYKDNRHPQSVEYVDDLYTDLSRRDFTINAIAYNQNEGIIDPFSGVDDINSRIIKTVGEANKRFQEDALRIMRALRFASVLGFEIEENTKAAIFNNKNLLLNVASERIYSELIKLIMGADCEKILLDFRDVISVIIPELKDCFDFPQNSKWHIYDVYTHIVKTVAVAPEVDYIRLALLFHDIGKPFCKKTDKNGQDHFKGHPAVSCELADVILKRFKVSNETYNKVIKLIEIHDSFITDDKADIKCWLNKLGEDLIFDYIDVKIADLETHNPELTKEEIENLKNIRKKVQIIINSQEPYRISDLNINGNDLIELGFKGKAIGNTLNELLDYVIENPDKNTKENLLIYLSSKKELK